MTRKEHPIDSIDDLRRLVPAIVKAINANEALTLRAAANPLLAMQEVGYTVTAELRPIVERRVRFPIETFERLNALAEQVFQIADLRFDIDSPVALDSVLFDKLGLPRPKPEDDKRYSQKRQTSSASFDLSTRPLPVGPSTAVFEDPLEKLRGAHAIMDPLLEYRKLEVSQPRLAPPDLYEQIKRGALKLPVTRLRARLQRDSTPQ